MSGFNRVTMKSQSHGEVMIYDSIGKDWWTGEGVTAKTFDAALKTVGNVANLDIRINSGGGDVFEGSAIYSQLVKHPAKKMVHIDGIAASMASIIAMAGDEIHMAANALFMIHEPSGVAVGDSEEMLKTAALLEQISNTAVGVYADRTGGDPATIKQQMKDETWFTAEQAKDAGFVTHITPNKQLTAQFEMSQFSKAPDWAKERLTQLSQKEPPQMSQQTEKPTETVTPPVDLAAEKASAATAERERASKITASCNLAKRPELAAGFIEDPEMTVEAVQAQLLKAVCSDNKPAGDESQIETPVDPDAEFKAAYKSSPEHQKLMSEQDYIALQKARLSGAPIGPKSK